MKDKLAEEMINPFIEKLDHSYVYKTINERENIIIELCKAIQAYHEAANKQITDEDIDTHFNTSPSNHIHPDRFRAEGAKAFRDGEIKHIEP